MRRPNDQREDRPKAGTELFCDLEEQKAEKQAADRREGAPNKQTSCHTKASEEK